LNYAGIPLTHRDHCSGFTVVTGHEDPTKPEAAIDYGALAKAPGTLVILMGVERLREISRLLVGAGKNPETPAAMVQWGTTGRQRSVDATLTTLADAAEKVGVSSPAIIVIGNVVRERSRLNWFENRPLHGRRIVVTRTRSQASELGRRLRDLGADVMEIPTLRMEPPQALQPLVECIVGITEYNWLFFRHLFQSLSRHPEPRQFAYCRRWASDVRQAGRVAPAGRRHAGAICGGQNR